MEIYIWFSVYLVLLIFLGAGIFTLLSRLANATFIHWLLLPGTIVSEMAYILGCLITGGEVKRAKIMPDKGSKGGGQPATEATPKLKFFGPVVAAMLSIVVCGAGIVVAHHLLKDSKDPLTQSFDKGRMWLPNEAAKGGALNTVWHQLHTQVDMLKQITQTLRDAKWLNWRVPLFVYLTICLGVTLSPASRPLRASLGAIVLIAAGIAIAGAFWGQMKGAIDDIWPLLSFVWALLLLVLVVCLLVSGVVGLMQALGGKSGKGAKAPKPAKAE